MMAAEATRSLIDRLPEVRGELVADAPLAPLTWFRAGGNAEVLFRPADADDLAAFITASPSSYHAATEIAKRLDEAGFARHDLAEPWDASPGGHYLVSGGAVMAWRVPAGAGPQNVFAIVGSHTDSPGFRVKPSPGSRSHGLLRHDLVRPGLLHHICCITPAA